MSAVEHARTVVESPPSNSLGSRPGVVFVALVPVQLFLAAGWMRAGVEKVIDPAWWSGDSLLAFLDEQRTVMLPWFVPFADHVITPLAPLVAWTVLVTQLAIAGCLLLNRHVRLALWAGIVLNLMFTMAGRVNPSAFYLVMEMALLFALSRPISETIAVRRAVAWLLPACFVLPFARTLDPHEVIDDPALMIATLCVLAAITTVVSAIPVSTPSWLGRSREARSGPPARSLP